YLTSAGSAILITITILLCIVSQYYVLRHLPVVDCLAYKTGNNIIEKMKIPEGAVSDSFAIKFKYRKAGKEVLFDSNSFPDDFNDSIYTFVDRVQELIRPGTATAPIADFVLNSDTGTDTTMAILNQPGYYVMLFSKDANQAESGWSKNAAIVAKKCAETNIPFFIVTSTTDAARQQLQGMQNVQYLKCDATVIKTAGRVNPTYFVMKKATIEGKYANADYAKVVVAVGREGKVNNE
ncbi:MAG: DoxX family protein, partial [Bacteroidota bacterium]|nr:DoxX family protein [Bacteroidota bacterium]